MFYFASLYLSFCRKDDDLPYDYDDDDDDDDDNDNDNDNDNDDDDDDAIIDSNLDFTIVLR
jgi:hypothetical protein